MAGVRAQDRGSSAFIPRRSGRSLATYVLSVVGITVAINGLIFALGWAGPSVDAARPNALLPPGWVIGGVWVVLLALLAVAAWLLASHPAPEARRLSPWVLALIGFCLAYPFYTTGLRSDIMSLAGNLATIAASALLSGRAWALSGLSAALIFLLVPWVSFATFAIMFGR